MDAIKKPAKLKWGALRRTCCEAIAEHDGWRIRETSHTKTKHPDLALVHVFLAFKEKWRKKYCRWNRKSKTWRYVFLTTGLNDKWQNNVVEINEKKKEVLVITRYQEYQKQERDGRES